MRSMEPEDIITFGTAVDNMVNANSTVKVQYKMFIFFINVPWVLNFNLRNGFNNEQMCSRKFSLNRGANPLAF